MDCLFFIELFLNDFFYGIILQYNVQEISIMAHFGKQRSIFMFTGSFEPEYVCVKCRKSIILLTEKSATGKKLCIYSCFQSLSNKDRFYVPTADATCLTSSYNHEMANNHPKRNHKHKRWTQKRFEEEEKKNYGRQPRGIKMKWKKNSLISKT